MLIETINNDLKDALKNRDMQALSVLRMIVSALNNEAIALKKKGQGLSQEEEIRVLKREVRKRKDSIEQYKKGGRGELAEKEEKELEILQKYLPEEMSQEENKKIVEGVISEMGEVLPSQFGKVMGQVMAKVKGKADGAVVSKVVKEVLNKQ